MNVTGQIIVQPVHSVETELTDLPTFRTVS